jgi:hypothetical protein
MSDSYPVTSYKDAAPLLRRPFTPAAVKFKVQATWPKGNPTGGLIVAYIDARLVVERLNMVCPDLWSDEYSQGAGGLLCALTIDGLTRSDIGSDYVGKGLYSDALKRAAVKFGVGVSLYAIPKMMLKKGADMKEARGSNGPTLSLTEAGERECRTLYANWLKAQGTKAFGEPLDHGDVEDAAGDHEAGNEPIVDIPVLDPALVDALKAAAKGLKFAGVKTAFADVGLPVPLAAAGAFEAVPAVAVDELAAALVAQPRPTLDDAVTSGAIKTEVAA